MTQLREHARQVTDTVRQPLVLDSGLLFLTTLVMAVATGVFWVLAAHLQAPHVVGVAGSLISGMVCLAYFSQLGLDISLVRTLPHSDRPRTDVLVSVLAVGTAGFVLGLAYALVLSHVSPALAFLGSSPTLPLAFAVLVSGTAVNLVTDSIFLSLRAIPANLLINGVLMGVARCVLPFVLVRFEAFGLFTAIGLSSLGAAAVSLVVIFRRLPPASHGFSISTQMRGSLGLAGAGYLASVLDLVPVLALPLIVLHYQGAAANGVYYVSFQIATLFNSVVYAIGQSMFAEGSREPDGAHRTSRRAAVFMLLAVGTSVAVVLPLSAFMLGIFGPDYAAGGEQSLRVLTLGALAVAFNTWAMIRLRMARRLRTIVVVQLLTTAAIVGGAVLVARHGIVWVAACWALGYLMGGTLAWASMRRWNPVASRTTRGDGRGHVLIVSHFYPPHVGGIEVVAHQQARGLCHVGFAVEVLTTGSGAATGVLVEDGVVVRRVRAWNGLERFGVPFPVCGPNLVWRAFQAVRRADVVHVHDSLYMTSWVTVLMCVVLRKHYVVSQHVGVVHHTSAVVRFVQAAVNRTWGAFITRRAEVLLPIHPFIAESHRAAGGVATPTRVLRNGVDVDLYHPCASESEKRRIRELFGLPQGEMLALYVGRFVPKKGFDLVTAATSDHYRLVLVGGDRPAHLDSPRLTFLGQLDAQRLAAVYRACDVFVGASVGEQPLTVQEAMASGLPVVLNDTEAYRALDLDDRAALFLPMTTETLRQTLEGLRLRRQELRERATAGRDMVERAGSWQSHLETLVSVYSDVMGAGKRRAA